MSKQTKQSGSNFGGEWTKQKLLIIDDYLKFYVTAMSKQKVKLIYIDAFAGSGKTVIKSGEELEGSPLIALKYDFDEYYFLEIDKKRIEELNKSVKTLYPEKESKVHIINGDSNIELLKILSGLTQYQRGIMFLDPYALELGWSILEKARDTGILDIWYLFPLNAIVRNLPRRQLNAIPDNPLLDRILGSSNWKHELYSENAQMSIFDEPDYVRADFDKLVEYIRQQLKSCFPYVAPNSRIMRNEKSSPLFILFFIMTNSSPKAIGLGSKVVKEILEKVEKFNAS